MTAQSAQVIAVIKSAKDGLSNVPKWQIDCSNAGIKERGLARLAAGLFADERLNRLDLKGGDLAEAISGWITDRTAPYLNYLNRRGAPPHAERRVLPTTIDKASSKYDWDAAIEAMLLFAAFPNLNPFEPLAGAKHAFA